MKSSLRWFTLAVSFILTAAGCKKDETAGPGSARDGGQKPPSPEQVDQAPAPADATAGAAPGGTAPGGSAPAGGGPLVATARLSSADEAKFEAWFKKYKIDSNDTAMLEKDSDGDGFTNRDEFLADTDPFDKLSTPVKLGNLGVHTGIRLKEYNEVLLPFSLESIQGDKATIKQTVDGKTVTVKQGDGLKGHPSLRIVRVEKNEDAVDKSGEHYDASQVEIEDTATKDKVLLIKDHPTRLPATSATLVSADGKTTTTVRRGQVFKWAGEGGGQFKVIDLSPDQAVLLQLDTNTTWTVRHDAER